ncbi:hypothetical protein MNB_SV-14-938 [hydrothermal vent metagenome]|uniref:Uncharacterized protein n=1 Tax=hydrothermal vent metagenome TaxID=652676 RepID=A0A1W1CA33_9ZZZZ
MTDNIIFSRSQAPAWECILEFNYLKYLFIYSNSYMHSTAGAVERVEKSELIKQSVR